MGRVAACPLPCAGLDWYSPLGVQTVDTTETVDVAGLVEAGLLDLDAVFGKADWRQVDGITAYTACVYGKDGDEPGKVQIVLESATEYGIVAYRWAEKDDGGTHERGPITIDRDNPLERTLLDRIHNERVHEPDIRPS